MKHTIVPGRAVTEEPILSVEGLKVYFYTDNGVVPGVDDLSFTLHRNETLAIAGESGCGKSVTSLSILRIVQRPGRIVGGRIQYDGRDLLTLKESAMRKIRGNDISMVFQEPMTSLNPVFTVGDQIVWGLVEHQHMTRAQARRHAAEMLRTVRIPEPERCLRRYPFELSGGMRQRVMIAMALASNPKVLIADEPTTALDVTIQAQILRLLDDLKHEVGTQIILITHDLGVVAHMAQNVMIMYMGKMVEYGDVESMFANPLHPYTIGLLRSIPRMREKQDTLFSIRGSVPEPGNYPDGCLFHPRCEQAMDICCKKAPPLCMLSGKRKVACWKYGEAMANG